MATARQRALTLILMSGIKATYVRATDLTDAQFNLECDVPGVEAAVQVVASGTRFIPVVYEGEGDDYGAIHFGAYADPVLAARVALKEAESFRPKEG